MTDNLLDIGDVILNETCFGFFEIMIIEVAKATCKGNGMLFHRKVGPEMRVRPVRESEDPFETYSLVNKNTNGL